MNIFITGICGCVGSTLARELRAADPDVEIFGIDNLTRPGSERNCRALKAEGIRVVHGDIRAQSDVDALPPADWVLDAAANPSVLAGVDGTTSSRQLVEHNLGGTVNLLEFCKRHGAGFTLLSTSRVYAIEPLCSVKVEARDGAFVPTAGQDFPAGLSAEGVAESFSTQAPVSLYGSTKLASEALALEYGATFGFPVWINRCGVLAGAGQFGRPDQGIFSFWINSWLRRAPLKYIGFDGMGHQVRDALHPRDLVPVLHAQFAEPLGTEKPRVVNFSGGAENSLSLRQLSAWCEQEFGFAHEVGHQAEDRPFDIPWMVLDPSLAKEVWDWSPGASIKEILGEIAAHARENEDWLQLSAS